MNLPTPSKLKAIMSRVTFLMLLLASSQTHVVAQESPKYNRDIRPLLSDRCFKCHGPDSHSRAADLRLDLQEEAVKDRGGYWAIVPGDADGSDLWERISTTDPDLVMPPPETGKSLSDEERTQLRNWIDQGATYEKHWAYAPLKTNFENTTLSETIDELVERELLAQGLHRNPEADETTLLRRLHLDLTGLPPTREQIESYLREESGDRYANRVSQLLESPQYGERMAMYWLDLVRYADTVGYHGDQDHAITPYRDWVI